MNCERCKERPAGDAVVVVGGDAPTTPTRDWQLCDVCSQLVAALLEGRPVFARGDASDAEAMPVVRQFFDNIHGAPPANDASEPRRKFTTISFSGEVPAGGQRLFVGSPDRAIHGFRFAGGDAALVVMSIETTVAGDSYDPMLSEASSMALFGPDEPIPLAFSSAIVTPDMSVAVWVHNPTPHTLPLKAILLGESAS